MAEVAEQEHLRPESLSQERGPPEAVEAVVLEPVTMEEAVVAVAAAAAAEAAAA